MKEDIFANYECEGQMTIEEYFQLLEYWKWENGFYMNLPVEDSVETPGEPPKEAKVHKSVKQ